MRVFIFVISFILFCIGSESFAKTVTLDSLDFYISRQSEYDRQKEERIKHVKEEILLNGKNNQQLYELYSRLFDEYRSYIYDSAYVYV